ncbi:hypothetical protein RhiirC2_799269, partial [Rhizophagus irregularis]
LEFFGMVSVKTFERNISVGIFGRNGIGWKDLWAECITVSVGIFGRNGIGWDLWVKWSTASLVHDFLEPLDPQLLGWESWDLDRTSKVFGLFDEILKVLTPFERTLKVLALFERTLKAPIPI